MNKTFILIIILGFLVSCGKDKAVSDIEKYVTNVSNRSDLKESITEIKAEDLRTGLMSEIVIYHWKDSTGKVYRTGVEFLQKDKTHTFYKFYFKNDNLLFARIIELDKPKKDTIMNSDYYFKGTEMLKQIDRGKENLDAETVRQVSEFYLVFAKENSE